MRYCGSVDTVPAYQRVKKQPESPEHFNSRPLKANNNHVQDKRTRKNSTSPHHIIADMTHKMRINSDDEQAEVVEVESLGRCLSYSPDAPKALGIASKRRVHSSRGSCRKGFDNKEPSFDASREAHNNTSLAHLLVRYQSIVELSSSSSPLSSSLSSSSSSTSPSTSSPHNNLILV